MTRGIIGCVILALLLAAGLGVQWAVEALQAPITGELTQAAQAAAREDWDTALLHQETAQRGWRKAWRLTAAFADHQPMEDVDSLFARLPAYGEDAVEFYLVGHYADLTVQPDETGARPLSTERWPIRMERTAGGWRVSEFHVPY